MKSLLIAPEQNQTLAGSKRPARSGEGILKRRTISSGPKSRFHGCQRRLVRYFSLQFPGLCGVVVAAQGVDSPVAYDNAQPGTQGASAGIRGDPAGSRTFGQK